MTKQVVPIAQQPITPPQNLDAILEPNDFAGMLGISRRSLIELTRKKRIPAIRVNSRVFRYHPRTVLAALSK